MDYEIKRTAINMQDYKQKLNGMSFEQLLKESEKINNKLNVSYIVLDEYASYYAIREKNIANNSNEMDRIFLRKEVMALTKIISGQLQSFANHFDLYWGTINEAFIKSTVPYPKYVKAEIGGKKIPLANKLNNVGLTAYKRYLLALSDNLACETDLMHATYNAIRSEAEYDHSFDRTRFYTRNLLPVNIDTIHKNLVKAEMVKAQMHEVGNYKQIKPEVEDLL